MLLLTILVTLLGLFHFSHGTFRYCKDSGSNLEACLIEAMNDALHQLKTDNKEYDLKNLDTYRIPSISIKAGTGAVHFEQNYRNIELSGLTDAVIKDSYFDRDTKVFSFTAVIPKLIQKADYDINGKLLTLPVTGSGSSYLQLDNMNLKIVLTLEEYIRDGTQYYKIKSIILDMPISRLSGHFDNLFNGNKLLGDNFNRLLNDEWEVIYNDIKRPLEEAYEDQFKMYIQKFLDQVPAKELF
ncbi:circadian clock-controlled protein daywake-like [Rhynchophorus ferrugineus]|uniref:circadian clock-controlled protein daywake-like n=1 Tax=Rhynchophorus ferrugineus TaxID=354439 RepID=UPI003FCD1E5C